MRVKRFARDRAMLTKIARKPMDSRRGFWTAPWATMMSFSAQNRNTPQPMLERALRVLRTHTGNPDFCNDEIIVPALMDLGVAPEDARNFSLSGCHEVIVTGRAQMGSVEGFINLPKILRLALGLEPGLSPDFSLESIADEETLWQALERSMELFARHVMPHFRGHTATYQDEWSRIQKLYDADGGMNWQSRPGSGNLAQK